MRISTVLVDVSLATWTSASLCPILGPVFPVPKTLASSPIFQSSLQTLRSTLTDALSSGNSSYGTVGIDDTYSVQIFSTSDKAPLFDFHRQGPGIVGNVTVDGDSVYRIASVSKVFTVYLLLLQAGETVLSEKVTKYVPELEGEGYWDDVTIGALAGYTAGITAEMFDVSSLPGGDINALIPNTFPPLAANETSDCAYGVKGCTREVFLNGLLSRRQVYLPNTTPAYGNAAFALLGLVLESITNTTYAATLDALLTTPLDLSHTSPSPSQNSSSAIIHSADPGDSWNTDTTDTTSTAMGGLFSSSNDLSALGRAILSSALLPPATTRAWLSPTHFTSSLLGAAGRPWEIYRAGLGPAENNRVVDAYTKSGNFGAYGANLVLLPDFEAGFVVLMAGTRGTVPITISSLVLDAVLPALEDAARREAHDSFAGTYSAAPPLNSSLRLSTSPGEPGLRIDAWISNGTDLKSIFEANAGFRIYPTNVRTEDGREWSWRSSYAAYPEGSRGPFAACPSWFAVDRPSYGVYGVDEFVFYADEAGKVTGVEPKALKVVLEKEG